MKQEIQKEKMQLQDVILYNGIRWDGTKNTWSNKQEGLVMSLEKEAVPHFFRFLIMLIVGETV